MEEQVISSNTAALFTSLDATMQEFISVIDAPDGTELNTVPYKGSWTAAQVAAHIIKANDSAVRVLNKPEKIADRKPDERVAELKQIFLDFTTKLQSPQFIIPTEASYNKASLLNDLKNIAAQIAEMASVINVGEISKLPGLGEITKLELLHFVLYHTQRHLHQLKNILQVIGKK